MMETYRVIFLPKVCSNSLPVIANLKAKQFLCPDGLAPSLSRPSFSAGQINIQQRQMAGPALCECIARLEANAAVAAVPGCKSTSTMCLLFSWPSPTDAGGGCLSPSAAVLPDLRRCKSCGCGCDALANAVVGTGSRTSVTVVLRCAGAQHSVYSKA